MDGGEVEPEVVVVDDVDVRSDPPGESFSQVLPRPIPLENARYELGKMVIIGFFGVVLLGFIAVGLFAWRGGGTSGQTARLIQDLLQLIIPAVAGVIGSVIGFYFGAEK
jgi:hypothetical protein